MEGETPNSVENPEAPAQGQEQIPNAAPEPAPESSIPEPEAPASPPPAENPAEVQTKIDEANRRLDEAYAEQAPVSEPAGALNPEVAPESAFPSVESTPAPQEQQPASPAPESAVEQQTGTMSEAETAAKQRIEAIGEEKLTDKENAQIKEIWEEGGPDRADKLNKLASRAEQRAKAWENTPKPEERPATENKTEGKPGGEPESKPEKPEVKNEVEDNEAKSGETKPKEVAENHASLHSLQKEVNSLRREIERLTAGNLEADVRQLREEKNVLQVEALNRELEELLFRREGLAEKVTGKNITEIMVDAEKKVVQILGYSTREDYVRALLPIEQNRTTVAKETSLLNQEWEGLSKSQQKKYGNNFELFRSKTVAKAQKNGFSEDEFYGLMASGYKPQSLKNKGLFSFRRLFHPFRSEKRIIDPDGKKVWMRTKDFKEMGRLEGEKFKNERADEAKNQLGEKWGGEVRRQTEELMEKEANNLEIAELKTREAYREQRIKMLSSYLKGLTGALRPARGLRAFEAEAKPDRDLGSFYDRIRNGAGMNGDGRRNGEAMSGFLDDFGIKVGPDRAAGVFSGGDYERAKRDGKLMSLVMDFIRNVMETLKVKRPKGLSRRRS